MTSEVLNNSAALGQDVAVMKQEAPNRVPAELLLSAGMRADVAERRMEVAAPSAVSRRKCLKINKKQKKRLGDVQLFEKNKRKGRSQAGQCGVCSEVFPSLIKLRRHIHEEHPKSYACHFCGCRFSHETTLKKHIAHFHELQNLTHACAVCGKRVRSERILRKHLRSHEVFKCEFCRKTFARECTLMQHSAADSCRKQRSSATVHACHLCDARYKKHDSLKDHIAFVHEQRKPKYGCAVCGMRTQNLTVFREHLDTHRGLRTHKCDICGDAFTSHNGLKQHFAVYHLNAASSSRSTVPSDETVSSFSCRKCNESFSTTASLSQHMYRTHMAVSADASRTCSLCNKTFVAVRSLKRHMSSVHLGLRTFTCKVCAKCFKLADHLSKHVSDVHERRKALCCAVCPFTTSDKEKLWVHIVRHYGFDRSHPELFPQQCDVCGLGFTERWSLKEHVRINHSSSALKCNVCSVTFASAKLLRIHVVAMHAYGDEKGKLYGCSHCELRFGAAELLIEHLSYHCNFMPHQCSLCPTGFRTQPELIAHSKKAHNTSAPNIPCLWCPKRLSHAEYMKHAISVHFAVANDFTVSSRKRLSK